ncbi:MFS transporter [Streptomyces indicus]|uniref:Predicted arabinose efflux permease, MFS family n=1 Tax=Streptomyces indicus TaxID=417292 RepID=A0A1G9FFD6_9ACTN|nr:MFS transporter [Streptomyces indicus]SDK87088.1 Predicted arabinose efflux permease, MFS family [Streptomyces indicus]
MSWTTARVLRDRNASLYLGAVVVSGFGSAALWLAGGVWVKDLTGSNALAALATFALWLPALAGPLLGTLADRVPRRPLLIGTNLGIAVLLTSLFTVDSAGHLWILLAVLLLYGAGGVVHDAAEAALVAAAVDKELLGDFNGLRMTANEGMKLLAPLAGAGLFAAYGGAAVALLDAVTFAAAAGLYSLLRVREEPPAPPADGWWQRTAEGARHLWAHPVLRPLAFTGGFTMLLSGVNGALIFAVVDEGLGHSPAYTGALYAVQGAGSVAVGLVSGPLLRRLGERTFAAAGLALFSVAVAGRALPFDAVALVCSAAIGAGLPCVLIAVLTAVQKQTPDALLGRVAATANTLVYAPTAVALGLGAGLVAVADHRLLLVALGCAGLIGVPALMRSGRAVEVTA